MRGLDQRLGLGDLITKHRIDLRRGKNTQLSPADLLRQSVYSRSAGHEDVNDAEWLSKRWPLTGLQQRLVKTGGRLVKHARYYWLLLAESHLTHRLFGSMVRRIDALAVPAA